jgi:hypothetical protein
VVLDDDGAPDRIADEPERGDVRAAPVRSRVRARHAEALALLVLAAEAQRRLAGDQVVPQ